jgi:glycerophosphoryl diester phosphodiesterase
LSARAPENTLKRAIGFAHRGASAHAPENTLAAFRLALEWGATGLESDVWLTRDGVAVLDHDGVLREGSAERPIREVARAQLPRHIPELAELYATCGADYELSLDVKDADAAPEVIAVARAAGSLERLWLCHWNWRIVAGWRLLAREVRLVDSTRIARVRDLAKRAEQLRDAEIDAMNAHYSERTAEGVATLRAAGRRTFAWDLQSEAALRDALALGVDAVYSDHVDRMMRALEAG